MLTVIAVATTTLVFADSAIAKTELRREPTAGTNLADRDFRSAEAEFRTARERIERERREREERIRLARAEYDAAMRRAAAATDSTSVMLRADAELKLVHYHTELRAAMDEVSRARAELERLWRRVEECREG